MAPRVGADDQGHRAMPVDVVEAVLRVVLDDEDAGFRPERLWLTASTIRPSARSLSATAASGVGMPGLVPEV